jgi:two-component system, sensor histidine kinase ChiS
MSFINKYNNLRTIAPGIFAIAIFSMSLLVPLSSHEQPATTQNSPVVKSHLNSWYYRWGNSPLDEAGIPLWTYQDSSESKWKLRGENPKFRAERQGKEDLWYMIHLPEGQWQYPALLVPPLIHSLDVYQGQRHIYRSGEFGPSDSNKYLAYRWHHIPLNKASWNNMVFLRIYSDSSQAIGIVEYPTIYG